MEDVDLKYMRAAIGVAWKSREKGNHPFGAVLVDGEGRLLLEGENTVVTGGDCTGHAETNLIRLASQRYDVDFLAACTLYTSTEPCPMCAGAIFWGNVRRVVYGLGQEGLYSLTRTDSDGVLLLPCRELFSRGKRTIEVVGPLLEDEARDVHVGFWR
jgi:tRNA(Arg) A34 adenosine deaminase TadA